MIPLLTELSEFLERQQDTSDSEVGPIPNEAMLLKRDVDAALERIERPPWEETFTSYPYFTDREERETWEWGDITHWHTLDIPLPPATHGSKT